MEFLDYAEVVFESGNILSAKMLKETYRYPRDFLKIFHNKFCDGIIAGLDFETRNDAVYLTAGIVKLNEKFYILSKDVNFEEWLKSQKLQSQEYLIVLTAEDVPIDLRSGISNQTRLTFKIQTKKPNHSLILGKYKFRSDVGIKLPSLNDSQDPFEKFYQASYLQLIETEYSHPRGGLTYHPLIFRAIQSYLEKKSPLSPYDFSLLLEIQNHGIVAESTLKSYIAMNKKIENMSREELFRELTNCIKMPYKPVIQYESSPKQNNGEIRSRRQSKLI